MLPELIEYAEKLNLVESEFLKPLKVSWAIHLPENGEVDVIMLGKKEGKKQKPKPYAFVPYTPPSELQSGGKSYFLADSLKTVLLLTQYKKEDNEFKFASIKDAQRKKQSYFIDLLEKAKKEIPKLDRELKAVISFLENEKAVLRIKHKLAGLKASPNDTVTFVSKGVDLLDSLHWHDWWSRKRQEVSSTNDHDTPEMICLATGLLQKPLKCHGKIKGVPGGKQMDRNLIANDKEAYQSYGLESSLNAAVGRYAEARYRAALNHLLERGLMLGNNSKFIYWTKQPVKFDFIKTIEDPVSDNNKQALDFLTARRKIGADTSAMELRKGKAIAEAVMNGEKPTSGETEFYAATLSGNGARIVIRDWIEMGMEGLYQNVGEWFSDLELVRPRSGGIIAFPKFGRILYLLVRDNLKELPDTVAPQIMGAAVTGGQITIQALQLALHRHQIESVAGRELPNGDMTYDPVPERIAFIKLAINRLQKNKEGGLIMTTALNVAENDKAYLCGRMLALFGKIQKEALGDVNVGVVQRFYGSASATPALVMGRLYKTMRYHLGNSNIDDKSRQDFEEEVKEITNLLDIAEPRNQWPLTLTLEEQGRFALGYYHQLAKLK